MERVLEFLLPHLLAMYVQESYLTSLGLSVLLFKMGVISLALATTCSCSKESLLETSKHSIDLSADNENAYFNTSVGACFHQCSYSLQWNGLKPINAFSSGVILTGLCPP